MKLRINMRQLLAVLLALLGIGAAVAGIGLAFGSLNKEPVMLSQPAGASENVSRMLELVSRGDYDGAGLLMQGQPSFGTDREASDEAGRILWDAFVSGFSYRLEGECYATNSGIAQDVSLTVLELDSVTASLRQRTELLLEQRLQTAEDMSEVYDGQNNFREDVVMAAYLQAMEDALLEDASYKNLKVTVGLVWRDGQWWIVPDAALLTALSGGLA